MELKFRAWDGYNIRYDITWFEHWHRSSNEMKWIFIKWDYYEIKTTPVMQYTWIKDKNWKEIYEGDIVRILYTDRLSKPANDIRTLEQYLVDQSMIAVVVFNEDRFCLKVYSEKYEDYSYNSIFPWKHWFIEIIWNIYEDKHLLAN